jgi:hypothetical protein
MMGALIVPWPAQPSMELPEFGVPTRRLSMTRLGCFGWPSVDKPK